MSSVPVKSSIGRKLTRIIVTTSSAAMLLGAALFAFYDWVQAKNTLATDLHLVADVDHFMLAENNVVVQAVLRSWLDKYLSI